MKVTTANIEWKVSRSNPPIYKADLGDTKYTIYRMKGKWTIADNHGAVYGDHATPEAAMDQVERACNG